MLDPSMDWLFLPYFWLAIGIAVLCFDIFFLGSVLLPVSIAAGFMTVLSFINGDQADPLFLSKWHEILIMFAVTLVASILILRLFVTKKKDEAPDINDY